MRLRTRAEVTTGMRVLVIEDEDQLCGLLREFLLMRGYQPIIAHTAEAALSLLHSDRPDAVLLDVSLPGMSGLEFLKLQTIRDLQVPILVMSGRVTERQAQECLGLGAFDFIGKPLSLARLEQVLACLAPVAQPPERASTLDRRHEPRLPVALPVRVHEETGAEWDGTSVNLSASGVKIRANEAVSPGAAATLHLTLPDGEPHVEVASVLVRADLDGYAFYFVNLTNGQVERLRRLVRQPTAALARPVEHDVRILHTIAQTINGSLDVDEVLRITLDALADVTGHECVSLHLLSADGATLHLRGDRGLWPSLREVNRVLPVGTGIIGRVAATGQTAHLSDVRESRDLLPATRPVVEREGIRGFVCAPIRHRGRVLGTLSLGRRTPQPFTAAEVALLEASADQIGGALENAELAATTRRQLEDLKLAESQLVEGDKLSTIGRLTAGFVHEIKNPLTVIIAQAELGLRVAEDPEKSRDRLRIILQETARATQLLQTLLKFSRRQPPERRPCALEDLVRWVLELKAPQLKRDQIDVITEFEPVPPVWVDEQQIQQVLLNLVQNAHEMLAAQSGERVLTLRVSPVGDLAQVAVLDNGPGIPPDVLPRLFHAFVTTKAPGEGTGLGLWVSSGIVEQHDGRLRAENRPAGGAAFTVELPYRRRPST
jgi:signal transduction histidine kinase/DNA-binding response OmpR family regulator